MKRFKAKERNPEIMEIPLGLADSRLEPGKYFFKNLVADVDEVKIEL
ncbi:MAG: hypothetical protein JXQ74_00265 [Alphaproteobacteria bacterium]|nr:hypothetical protein [Alphaproteobacteria bacterium]